MDEQQTGLKIVEVPEAKFWFQSWWIGWALLFVSRLFSTKIFRYNLADAAVKENSSVTMVTVTSPRSARKSPSQTTCGLTSGRPNDLINALRRCGVEDIFRLPKIAVIGNQSVGKSSLIESISGIKVPRSIGTCTRCPMEVTMRSDKSVSKWTCQVSIFDAEQKKTVPFGKATHDREEVESVLRRAQLAALNPSRAITLFVDLENAECEKFEYVLGNGSSESTATNLVLERDWEYYTSESQFSEKSIVVEINGEEVDLTFIDLPGIIHNSKVRSKWFRFLKN
jgi:GTPase SAR1 family protein